MEEKRGSASNVMMEIIIIEHQEYARNVSMGNTIKKKEFVSNVEKINSMMRQISCVFLVKEERSMIKILKSVVSRNWYQSYRRTAQRKNLIIVQLMANVKSAQKGFQFPLRLENAAKISLSLFVLLLNLIIIPKLQDVNDFISLFLLFF